MAANESDEMSGWTIAGCILLGFVLLYLVWYMFIRIPDVQQVPVPLPDIIKPNPPPDEDAKPSTTVVQTPAAGYRYLGCYYDSGRRPLPKGTGHRKLAECAADAKAAGYKVFGTQYQDGIGGGYSECWFGNDTGYSGDGTDKASCTEVEGNMLGNAFSNAVYTW